MPLTQTSDGITLTWQETGSGPDVILVPYWLYHPDVFAPMVAELQRDHRVITYDDRGTGRSDRVGPYDVETGTSDLEAVAEAAGLSNAAAFCMTDGANRAVRVAARQPELIQRVVCVGGAPLQRSVFTESGSDGLIASDAVVEAFLAQLRTYYRGALRSVVDAGNQQMTADERADRVAKLIDHLEEEATIKRLDAWQTDSEATAIGRSLSDRLIVLIGDDVGGGWFPSADQVEPILRKHLPEAVVRRVSSGMVSAPDEIAAVIREPVPLERAT